MFSFEEDLDLFELDEETSTKTFEAGGVTLGNPLCIEEFANNSDEEAEDVVNKLFFFSDFASFSSGIE